MGFMFAAFGLAGLTGLVSDVELSFFGIDLNNQPRRIYLIVGCVLAILLGIFLMRKKRSSD